MRVPRLVLTDRDRIALRQIAITVPLLVIAVFAVPYAKTPLYALLGVALILWDSPTVWVIVGIISIWVLVIGPTIAYARRLLASIEQLGRDMRRLGLQIGELDQRLSRRERHERSAYDPPA